MRRESAKLDYSGMINTKADNLKILSLLCVLLFSSAVNAGSDMDPGDRMKFADGLFARGMYKLAVEEYKTLLAEHPEFAGSDVAYYRLGDAYRQMGKHAEAQKEYARVFKLYPQSKYADKAGIKRADIFIREKRFEEGVELYRRVLKANPSRDVAAACCYFMGDALLNIAKTNEAKKAYAKITDKYTESEYYPFAMLRLANIGIQEGLSADKVLKYYRAASTNSISQRAAAEALYQIGRLEYDRQAYDSSSEAFSMLAQKYPEDKRTEESMLDAGWAMYNAGFTAKALQRAGQELAGAGEDKDLQRGWLYLRANAERALKKYREAIRSYSILIEMGGGAPSAYVYEKALCHFALEEYNKALSLLEGISLKDDSIREDVLWLLGRASEELKRQDDSFQYFSKLNKDFPDGRFAAGAKYHLADILRQRNDYKGAAQFYGQIADKHSGSPLAPRALMALGVCWLEAGELEKALDPWKSISEKYPDNKMVPESILNRVSVQMRLDRIAKASETIREFMARFAQHRKAGEAHYWLGMIAVSEGKHSDAEKAFSKALSLDIEGAMKARAKAYRALAIYRAGEEKRAAEELLQLSGKLELATAGRNIFLWLVQHSLDSGDSDKAADAAEKLLKLSTATIEKQEALCMLGRANELAEKTAAAYKAYKDAYSFKEPSLFRAEAALALGNRDLREGKFETALNYFGSAARMAEESDGLGIRARAYLGMGKASEATKNLKDAARYYMSVAILFDDDQLVPLALKSAARCYGNSGRDSERQKVLNELRARFPKSGTVADD